MLPSRLVLVVYVCVRVFGRADSSALINDQLIQLSSPAAAHHITFKYSPLSHSFVRSLFVSPGCVWSRLRSSLVPSTFQFVFLWSCHSGFVTSHQHFSSQHSSDHRSPCATILFLFGLHKSSFLWLIKSEFYLHTVSAFPSWHFVLLGM